MRRFSREIFSGLQNYRKIDLIVLSIIPLKEKLDADIDYDWYDGKVYQYLISMINMYNTTIDIPTSLPL